MKKLCLLIVIAIAIVSCSSPSGRRDAKSQAVTVQPKSDMPCNVYVGTITAYINDSIVAQKEFVMKSRLKSDVDEKLQKKVSLVSGMILCDSIKCETREVELLE